MADPADPPPTPPVREGRGWRDVVLLDIRFFVISLFRYFVISLFRYSVISTPPLRRLSPPSREGLGVGLIHPIFIIIRFFLFFHLFFLLTATLLGGVFLADGHIIDVLGHVGGLVEDEVLGHFEG